MKTQNRVHHKVTRNRQPKQHQNHNDKTPAAIETKLAEDAKNLRKMHNSFDSFDSEIKSVFHCLRQLNGTASDDQIKAAIRSAYPKFFTKDEGVDVALRMNENKNPTAIPQSLAYDANAALMELDRAAQAALALLFMTVNILDEEITSNQPKRNKWPLWLEAIEIDVHNGIADLAIDQTGRLSKALNEWDHKTYAIIEGTESQAVKLDIELEIYSLNTLLLLHGMVHANLYANNDLSCGPILLAQNAAKKLNAAYLKTLSLRKQLLDASKGITTPEPLPAAA